MTERDLSNISELTRQLNAGEASDVLFTLTPLESVFKFRD